MNIVFIDNRLSSVTGMICGIVGYFENILNDVNISLIIINQGIEELNDEIRKNALMEKNINISILDIDNIEYYISSLDKDTLVVLNAYLDNNISDYIKTVLEMYKIDYSLYKRNKDYDDGIIDGKKLLPNNFKLDALKELLQLK